MNPSELHASQRAGSRPRELKDAVVRSSVVRTFEVGCFDEEEAVELAVCSSGLGERAPFDCDPDATDPDSESDMARGVI